MQPTKLLALFTRVRNENDVLPWFAANACHADDIYILDTGSDDGTQDSVKALAERDERIHLGIWPEDTEWYHDQGRQMDATFALAGGTPYRWYVWQDADEIPNIMVQSCLRAWLHERADDPSVGTAYAIRYHYLRHGWKLYYVEPGQWKGAYVWNYRPHWETNAIGGRTQTDPPERTVEIPDEYHVLHFDWAMERRFARKRLVYERRWNAPSWHPDEKYQECSELPYESQWYAPDGRIVLPKDMPGVLS